MSRRGRKDDQDDSLNEFMNSLLKPGENETAYYCRDHGKSLIVGQLVDRPKCIFCRASLLTEEEWENRGDLRYQRKRRVSMLRNFLEGDGEW